MYYAALLRTSVDFFIIEEDMKRVVLIIGSLLILLAIPATIFLVMRNQEIRQRAAPATTLTLTPSALTKQVGDTFTLEVHMDTAANQVVAVQVSLAFDPTKLEAEWIHNGTMFPNILSSGVVGNGTASIQVGSTNTITPVTGTGLVATINMKALAGTTTPVTVKFATADTYVGALGEGSTNVLTSSTPSTITIGGGVVPTPSPTGNPSDTLTPTLSPTPESTDSATSSAVTIDSPTKDESIATQKPTIEGKAPPGSTVTIAVYSTQQITATVTADANGNWTYTIPNALETGPHTVVVAAQNPTTGQTETATLAFVVSNGTENGASGSAMPASGSVEPTILLLALGMILLLSGALAPVLIRNKS